MTCALFVFAPFSGDQRSLMYQMPSIYICVNIRTFMADHEWFDVMMKGSTLDEYYKIFSIFSKALDIEWMNEWTMAAWGWVRYIAVTGALQQCWIILFHWSLNTRAGSRWTPAWQTTAFVHYTRAPLSSGYRLIDARTSMAEAQNLPKRTSAKIIKLTILSSPNHTSTKESAKEKQKFF